jgi:hypothetical protein
MALLLCSHGFAEVEEQFLIVSSDTDDISEPVKSVRIKESWYHGLRDKRYPETSYLSSICSFSENGILKERLFYSEVGDLTYRWQRSLSDQGKIQSEVKYKKNDILITKGTYIYDSEGRRSQSDIYLFDGKLDKQIRFIYDDQGILKEQHELKDGQLTLKTIYEYDENNNLLSFTNYDKDQKMEVKEEHRYGPDGNIVSSVIINKSETVIASMVYKHDDHGRKTEVMAFSKGGRIEFRRLFQYNDQGDMSRMTVYSRGGHFSDCEAYRYKYDEHGNWIEKHESTARVDTSYQCPIRIVYRSIEYYDLSENSFK